MINLATSDSHAKIKDDLDFLVLPATGGATPKTVYVKPLIKDNITKAGFALVATSEDWHTAGVVWQFHLEDVKYGLFINFVLLDGIVELERSPLLGAPVFWFSETWVPTPGSPTNQSSCAPIVANTKTVYSFLVKLPDGSTHDPKIVVTPFPNV